MMSQGGQFSTTMLQVLFLLIEIMDGIPDTIRVCAEQMFAICLGPLALEFYLDNGGSHCWQIFVVEVND
jgi:hypothetical protein